MLVILDLHLQLPKRHAFLESDWDRQRKEVFLEDHSLPLKEMRNQVLKL